MEQIDWFAHESAARQRGFIQVCGIDEAGRGPLAGPVFAAAVLLPVGVQIEGLNDSKKLSEKKREQLFDVIQETAISTSIAFATEQEIDEQALRQVIDATGYRVSSIRSEPYQKKGLFSFGR